jgi:glucan phosphoethanolaminetransferase (alkaline phosphatase superfamily)
MEFLKRKDGIWVIVLSFIVLIPNIFLFFMANSYVYEGGFGERLLFLLASFALFLVPSFFLKARTFFLVQGFFVLLSPFETAHVYVSKAPITSAFFATVFETSLGESLELLSSILPLILAELALWFFYFYIGLKKIDNTYFCRSKKVRYFTLGAFALVFTIIVIAVSVSLNKSNPSDKLYKTTVGNLKKGFNKIYPYDLLIKAFEIVEKEIDINKKADDFANFSFGASKHLPISEREVYLFVIGETGRYENFSINGYWRKTSPLLEQTENLLSFSELYSEANLTHLSIPIILTRASAVDFKRYYGEKTFVDAFKEAGFKTYWIGNQSMRNEFVQRTAKDTDGAFFAPIDFDPKNNYDETLWKYLNDILKKEEEKVLIVIHTLGSHFRYDSRYPKTFDKFRPSLNESDKKNVISPECKEILTNTYDNSILYTDYFLANTINKIDSLDAVSAFMYVADHGENLYDTEDLIVLHANSTPTVYDFHVPMFVWTSEKYKCQYPDKVNNLEQNKDKKISMSYIFQSFLDLGDIHFGEEEKEKSIFSDKLEEDSIHYILQTDMHIKAFETRIK